MTGYPGDEHVFCVVVVVLARSPDCNSHILVTLRLLQLCCCVQVCDLCVFHLLAGLWAVKVSVVSLCKVCRVSCVSCRLIPKQQLTSDAAAVKRTAVFTTGFGAAVEGSKSEHTTSCDWSFGTRRVDECLTTNERIFDIEAAYFLEGRTAGGRSFLRKSKVQRDSLFGNLGTEVK